MPRKTLKVLQSRKAFTASFKLSVCEVAEKKGNRAAGREFGIDESNVRRWLANKAKLLEIPGQKKAQRGGIAKWPQLEEQLIIWITEERQQGNKTSVSALRRKAREFAAEAGITDFTASVSWASGFLGRHGISTPKLTSNPLPEDLEENMTLLRSVFKEEIDDEDFEGF